MKEDQFKQILKVLNDISSKTSILISLQKLSVKIPSLGKEEKIILNLCNGKNTVEGMMKITNKTRTNIEVTLIHLKKKGLIRSTKLNKKTVYVKI